MSIGGALSASALAALANDGDDGSIAMRWVEMVFPEKENEDPENDSPKHRSYTLKVIEKPTNDFVRLIKDPLNLISVMGPARSGKSTLMNLLAGCKKTELFATYPGSETFTKGIFIPTRVLTLPKFSSLEDEPAVEASDSKNIQVTFVDTEGQGALGDPYDMNLFSPALLTSRLVIYNRTGGLLIEEILSQLGMMVLAAQRLTVEKKGSETMANSAESSVPTFGHLFILFNQFRTTEKDTPQYLQSKLLTPEKETDENSENRNKIRELLGIVFESIQVFILPDRLKPEARQGIIDGTKNFLLLTDFDDVYLEYFKTFRTSISKALVRPRDFIQGTPLTGGSIADFMCSFAEAINKSEPLNIPTIFESAQNDAINKSIASFTTSLTLAIDGRLKEDAKPTQALSLIIDKDVNLLLSQLASTISYMAPSIIRQVQNTAFESAQPMKEALLNTNLARLMGIVSSGLTAAVMSIPTMVSRLFPPTDLLLAADTIQNRFNALWVEIFEAYKAKGESLDVRAFPEKWVQVLQEATEGEKRSVSSRVEGAWDAWALNASQQALCTLTEGLVELGNKSQVGENDSYESAARFLLQNVQLDFEKKMATEYWGSKKEAQTTAFATAADSALKTQLAQWQRNVAEVKKQLQRLLDRLTKEYSIRLQNSLSPRVEPPPYEDIVDVTLLREQLIRFLERNNVASEMAEDVTLRFDDDVSLQRSKFNDIYTRACNDYSTYLNEELKSALALILEVFNVAVDSIPIKLEFQTTNRLRITQECQIQRDLALDQAELLQQSFGTRSPYVVSKNIFAMFLSKLNTGIAVGIDSKISTYQEAVSGYNKALLSALVVPLIDSALANKFISRIAFDDEVQKVKADFMQKARGEEEDRNKKWTEFLDNTYQALAETVERNNAYKIPGLEGTQAATKEIQLHVIKNIYRDCANMANCLGMSYIDGSCFNSNAVQDMGEEQIEPPKEEGKDREMTRTFRLNNNFTGTSEYMWERKTNLEFFEWTVEVSDIIFGRPVITDLKPTRINTQEFPAQSDPPEATVGSVDTEQETITDTVLWGISGGVEAAFKHSYSKGAYFKTVWETSLSTTFNAKLEKTHSTTATSTYTSNTSVKLRLPANRINLVHQMIFNQRTTLPYTARVRVVPHLRFQNGFTKWGGGGSYRDNPGTAAIKEKCKESSGPGGRQFRDFEFNRCDEIRDDARSDADPWEWLLAMERQRKLVAILNKLSEGKLYEVYVKGKWEGCTGKYAVTTVTPKNTALTLMPLDI